MDLLFDHVYIYIYYLHLDLNPKVDPLFGFLPGVWVLRLLIISSSLARPRLTLQASGKVSWSPAKKRTLGYAWAPIWCIYIYRDRERGDRERERERVCDMGYMVFYGT